MENTKLYGVPEMVTSNATRRCNELNRDLVAIGKNGGHYVVLARKRTNKYENFGMGWFDVWTSCDEEGNFNYGSYDLSEETAMSIFYSGNSYLRTEIIDNSSPCSYERLSEIATLLKDGLVIDGYDEAMEYLMETVKMTSDEAEYFGINEIDLFSRNEE